MKKKLSVAFLWHMHQPLYKDFVTGRYHLPWVRLHATYSYLDMASMFYEFPGIKATFNFTPSLLWQLLDLSNSEAVDDVFLNLSRKDARYLVEEDKVFLLRNFFSCHPETAIFPIKKYKELFFRRGNDLRKEELLKKIKVFSESDFRDLQVYFNLAWCGFTMKEKDPIVKELLGKGADYAEDDKLSLLKRQKDAMALVIPTYKKLQEEGRIEISTSPYYHPILPLLCSSEITGEVDFCDDARVQTRKGIELYRKVFGRDPLGMWPPEGSVNQEIIPVLADEGIKWIATDEGILKESFRGKGVSRDELVYKAYTVSQDGRDIDIIFRDVNISNAISFRYSGMRAKNAARDLIKDISGIQKATAARGGEHIVSIILDGENPWPYYLDSGKDFLAKIYKYFVSAGNLETVTIGEYLNSHKERKKIEKISSGSWIDCNFSKWTGSPQKDLAWKYLEEARKELFRNGQPSSAALEELHIAEGSDWFWWYDEFGNELNLVFDELFRMHLANIYRLAEKEVPEYLKDPIPKKPIEEEAEKRMSPRAMASYPKVLMVSPEIFPFAKTGGLADVIGSLSKELASLGCEVRTIMPLYRSVVKEGFKLKKEAGNIKSVLLKGLFGFNLCSIRDEGVTTYFIGKKKYFARKGLYGTSSGDYPDNVYRFAFFSKAVLAALKTMDFKPDIIHCNDWQTALIPFYLRFKFADDSFYNGIKTFFTIHNMAYQGVFNKKVMHRLDIPENFFNMNALEFYGNLSLMKSGILYSDIIGTVSERYSREIMTPEYGCGLEGLLGTRKERLYGILNGVDYSVWSPENDHFIKVNFDLSSIQKKAECKKDLIEHTRLSVPADAPLLGCISRLVEQKGMDLVAGVTDKIVKIGAGIIILGKGDGNFNRLFLDLEKKYKGKVKVCLEFNDELAHKIEAGCDMFLMPSRYEPCGLNQMYSIKYGTIPIVRATGGLDEVILDFDEDRERGNGFKFVPADEEALFEAIGRAAARFKDKTSWHKLMINAMSCDFSWRRSAKEYLHLYRRLMG